MTVQANPFLATLKALLHERGHDRLYCCIQDLVENGLVLARFSPGASTPQRQDITQYLAAWSRHAGLSDDECRAWLIEFCAEVLAPISRRTPAAIRHSTKSNIKYIYGAEVPFLCECEGNRFRARCCSDCPVHADMQAKLIARANEPKQRFRPLPPPPQPTFLPPVKEVHKAQFEVAQRLILEELAKGSKKRRILELLHQRELKTRTGRPWTYSILVAEIPKIRASHAGSEADRDRTAPA